MLLIKPRPKTQLSLFSPWPETRPAGDSDMEIPAGCARNRGGPNRGTFPLLYFTYLGRSSRDTI